MSVIAEVGATVAEVWPDAPDAATLRLDLGGRPFEYRPGQYIEIDPHQFTELAADLERLEAEKGVPESPRGFSLSSDGLHPSFIEITVKEEKPGRFPALLGPFLVRRVQPGQSIKFSGPMGRYCLPGVPPPIEGILHLCAGSGVAPNRGMIRYALAKGWPQQHLLVLQNRRREDIFYRGEWPSLQERHPGKFRIRHVLSKDEGEHVSVDLLGKEMQGFFDASKAWALVCGPNQPRETIAPDGQKLRQLGFCELWCGNRHRKTPGLLEQLGFSSDRILTEMW